MAQDIASLSLSVDSRPIQQASTSLREMRNEAQDTAKATDQLNSSSISATDAIKGLAAAFGLYKLAEQVKQLAELQGKYEMYGVALRAVGLNAGYTSQEVDKYTDLLQKNGIAMMESRTAMTQAIQAHIQMADAVKLGRIAQDAAVIGNINSSEAFQSMIHGLQTGQVRILHTIGLMADFEGSEKKLAASMGKTTAQLTDRELAQARVNAVLEKGKDIEGVYEASLGSAGKQLLSMKRYADDLELTIGQTFGPAYTTLVFSMADALKGAKEEVEGLKASGQLDIWATELSNAMTTTIKDVKAVTTFLWQHRDAIISVGQAYIGLKVTDTIRAMTVSAAGWVKTKYAAVTASIASAQAEVAEATTRMLAARALVAQQGGIYASVKAKIAERTATEALAAAEARLAAAKSASALAAGGARAAMAALGGPIGVAVAAVGALITAWMVWGDKINASEKQEREAIKRGNEFAESIERQVAAMKEKNRLEDAKKDPKATVQDKTPDAVSVQLKEQEKLYGASQVRLQQLKAGFQELKGRASIEDTPGRASAAYMARLNAITAEEEKQKEILATHRRIQQAELDRQNQEAENDRREAATAAARKAENEKREKEEQAKLKAKEKQSTQQEILNKLEAEELAVMDKSTLSKDLAVKLAESELKAKRDIDDLDKRKKTGTITAEEYDSDKARVLAIQKKRDQKLIDDAIAEQEEVDRQTREQAGIQAELSWEQKVSKMKEKFAEINRKRAEKELAPLSDTDMQQGIRNLMAKERAAEVNKLTTELGKLAEEKGRALNFDEQLAALDKLAQKIGVTVPGAVDELRRKLQQTQSRRNDGWGGMIAGMEEWSDKATDLFSNMKDKVQGWASASTEALVQFTTKGKSAFKDFAISVIQDLQRIAIQQTITGPLFELISSNLTDYLTGGTGGEGISSDGMEGLWTWYDQPAAGGGFRSGKKPYLVGENGPEIFNPGGPGTIIPNDKIGGGAPSIQFNTTINTDGSSTSSVDGSPDDMALALEAAHRRFINREMEPGGSLWQFVRG